jgi:hypothetical protein
MPSKPRGDTLIFTRKAPGRHSFQDTGNTTSFSYTLSVVRLCRVAPFPSDSIGLVPQSDTTLNLQSRDVAQNPQTSDNPKDCHDRAHCHQSF